MQLAQDLLLVDMELANPDAERGAILQLSALQLDAKNLLEKRNFNTYVRPAFADGDARLYIKQMNVEEDTLRKAPRLQEILHHFYSSFHDACQFASFGLSPYIALVAASKKAGIKNTFSLPIFDVWTPLYLRSLKFGARKLPNLETLAGYYKLTLKNQHDALERVRLTADLLRRVL